ncbi:MAG: DUF2239 family protein [Deltaproteobacteria bacterium]|nr:DUF2239 family protein [Deltaproteobacteria bacterium]
MEKTFTIFAGNSILVTGPIEFVVRQAKRFVDSLSPEDTQRVAIFSDDSSHVLDIDFRGTEDEVVARLATHPLLSDGEPVVRGRGRPKLGVVGKEVSLLPRHWEWLSNQRGGASATLRRLVDEARKSTGKKDELRRLEEAAHRFMWDMAGNLPNFEEASRLFYQKRYGDFKHLVAQWPSDIAAHTFRLLNRIEAFLDAAKEA